MRIAINARLLKEHPLEDRGYFIREVFLRLAKQQPKHEFLFFDEPFNSTTAYPKNAKVVVSPKALHPLANRWWLDVQIPGALKKFKADVFVSPDGFCSLVTNVPQVVVVHDITLPGYSGLYKIFLSRSLRKAKVVCTLSEVLKGDIISRYGIAEDKMWNLGIAAAPVFKPVEWEEKENTKEKFSDGCEYFVYVESAYPENLVNLVKAFSIFKKWQKTNMKLLLVENVANQYKETVEKLKTYKYRDDVKVLSLLQKDELAKVLASAYALVLPALSETFCVPIVAAMECGVPIITSDKKGIRAVGGEAALYTDPLNPDEIAAQMKMIFKDEQLRNKLIEIGKVQVQTFTWERTVEQMWKSIQQAVSH